MSKIFLLLTVLMTSAPGWAVTPIEYFNSLIAGGDEAGFHDGTFVTARFNQPVGLSFNEAADKLFVADSGNHRIRVVDLKNNNQVETLTGTDLSGKEDGSFDKASFNTPTRLVALPQDRLAVYDTGNGLIRLIDLKTKSVSTIASGVTIWDLVYRPQDDSLYFSEPDAKTLARLDLKSKMISIIFSNNDQVPFPQALCLTLDKFYVSDRDTSTVYEINLRDVKSSDQKVVTLNSVGQGNHIIQLAYSDGSLYALQSGPVPLVRVGFPQSPAVSLGTGWAFKIAGDDPQSEPFLAFAENEPIGFIASPTEARKLLVSQPHVSPHAVISVKDYNFNETWKARNTGRGVDGNSVMDYHYPAEKPMGIFRILLAGDSRTFIAPRVIPGSTYDTEGWFYGAPRPDTMAKQLELFLNTEAAIRGVKTHFEVLEWNREGYAFSSYANSEIPPLVKKYHVDMVLAMVGWPGYFDYFMNPMTEEGVPRRDIDYEYILKPLSQRIPPGVAADLYQRYKKKVTGNTEKLAWPGQDVPWGFVCSDDPEIRKDTIWLTAQRIQRMSEKIDAMKITKAGYPNVVLFYVPQRNFPSDSVDSFWRELAAGYGFPYVDIDEAYRSQKISYYPAATECCDGHYTAYGSKLIGYLLSHYLVEDKLIPFGANRK